MSKSPTYKAHLTQSKSLYKLAWTKFTRPCETYINKQTECKNSIKSQANSIENPPDENVNNSAPIPIESQHPQSGHAQVPQPMGETHEVPRDHMKSFLTIILSWNFLVFSL